MLGGSKTPVVCLFFLHVGPVHLAQAEEHQGAGGCCWDGSTLRQGWVLCNMDFDPDERDFLPEIKYTPMAKPKSSFQPPVKTKKKSAVAEAPFFRMSENKYLKKVKLAYHDNLNTTLFCTEK